MEKGLRTAVTPCHGVLLAFALCVLGCGVSGGAGDVDGALRAGRTGIFVRVRESGPADLKVRFHYLRTFDGTAWKDVSGQDVLGYGAGDDDRFSGEDDRSFVFTLAGDTPPGVITSWFFQTSLGSALKGVEASVRFVEGNPGFCGIHFPSAPVSMGAANYESYLLGVNASGEFEVCHTSVEGETARLVPARKSAAVKSGFDTENVLTAYFDGGILVMRVNGVTVHTE